MKTYTHIHMYYLSTTSIYTSSTTKQTWIISSQTIAHWSKQYLYDHDKEINS